MHSSLFFCCFHHFFQSVIKLVIGLFIIFCKISNIMSDQTSRPLILNDSLKDSVDQTIEKNQRFDEKINASINSASVVEPLDSEQLKKRRKRLTCLQVCSAVFFIIAVVITFAFPPLIQSAIVEQAKQQVIMTSNNEGLWAHFPGDTKTIILRNFTFFKFENQAGFLFKNQKPAFTEYSGYKIQELEDFLDITYLDDGNLVKVRDWVRFDKWAESKDIEQKVSILNMGNFGYWSTLKQARPTLLLQQGLALIFTNLEASLIPTLLGSGLNQQFLTNSSSVYSSLLAPAGISKINTDFFWSDPAFGMSDKENLGVWAQASIECYENEYKSFSFSRDAIMLKNYFAINDIQMQTLMEKMYTYVKTLRSLLLENHYCVGVSMKDCTGRYLGVAQMADGWVTANTPPVSTISPNDTICDDNVTCHGLYPEPFAFARNIFKADSQLYGRLNAEILQTVKFPRESVLNWFNYNNSIQAGLNYNTAQNCLLHIGNLDDLWAMGEEFERNFDLQKLEPIRTRFGLDSIEQTLVFWNWIRYFTNQFVLQRAGNARLGMSNLFTSGFYEQFAYLKDNLQPFILAKMLKQNIETQQCHSFFEKALDEANNPDLINSLCHNFTDIHTNEFARKMVNVCESKFGSNWQELVKLGASPYSLDNLCDPSGTNNVGAKLHEYKTYLDTLYGCNVTPNSYCSDFELALIQWQNATVTSSPPEMLVELKPSLSFSAWDKNAEPIQYEYFIQKFIPEDSVKFPRYSLFDLVKKFTFEDLFSTNLLISKLRDNQINPYFLKYIRYVCIYVTLNGLTTSRKVSEFLFGYEDEYIASVKNSYPPFGGDPSAPSIIAFNDLNLTKEQANQTIVFKTGKNDYRDVYQNYQINGYKYLVNQVSMFNGNKTVTEWKSPWAEKDYFYGTTAKIFAPNQFEADNLSLLIPQVQRYGSNFFHNETEQIQRFGMDLYRGYLNARIGELSKANDKYYQTIPNVFNSTSIYGLPLYITKNHFMNATQWLDKVDIYNEDHSILYKQISNWDQTFILVEPYTGVSFQSCIYLQNNYLHKKDPLYDYEEDVLLPIFSISRSGNLTEEVFHDLYDPLVMAFTIKAVMLYVGIGLMVVFAGLLVFSTIKKRKLPAGEELKSSQLGISLQQVQSSKEGFPEVTEEEASAQT